MTFVSLQTTTRSTAATRSRPAAGAKFRADIQGLRAVAVGLVVIYHLWPTSIPGGFIGVDVFFVISGFLITSHLLAKPPRRPRDVADFWLRRVKRLLPASFLVIAASAVGMWALAPETVWRDWSMQGLAATVYAQNWFLAASSVDYLAEDNAASVFQHFWSLSVEEQFYFFWPMIIGLLVWAKVRRGGEERNYARLGIWAIAIASLAYCIFYTATEPGIAYFSTFTRAWELAAGGVVATLPAFVQGAKSSRIAALASWVGLAAIVVAAFSLTGETPFPGTAALLPVVGTALVIGAQATHRASPLGLLGHPVMRWLGDNSYSVYLWHWPLIVLVPYVTAGLGMLDKLAILIITLVLAALSKKFIEDRFRRTLDTSKVISGFRFLIVGSLVVALVNAAVLYRAGQGTEEAMDLGGRAAEISRVVGEDCFGANAVGNNDCPAENPKQVAPKPIGAKADKSEAYADGCWSAQEDNFAKRPICHYGDGEIKVALLGNSHAGQWLPALQPLAAKNDWSIDTYLASRCAPSDAPMEFDSPERNEGCLDYGRWAKDKLAEGDYDLIVASNRQSLPIAGHGLEDSTEPAEQGYASYLKDLQTKGTEVVVIRDTPYPGAEIKNVPDCVATGVDVMNTCDGTPATWKSVDPMADAAKETDASDISVLDMTSYFCPEGSCEPVIGSVITYFDGSHITATYAKTLSDPLEEKMRQQTDNKRLWK